MIERIYADTETARVRWLDSFAKFGGGTRDHHSTIALSALRPANEPRKRTANRAECEDALAPQLRLVSSEVMRRLHIGSAELSTRLGIDYIQLANLMRVKGRVKPEDYPPVMEALRQLREGEA